MIHLIKLNIYLGFCIMTIEHTFEKLQKNVSATIMLF